jgi:16S rRNA (adenine1518-N6/adenine1519-N6)-dimethyltransferase
MQKLGQHFLKNTAVLQTIANALEVQNGETVIEVGPGHGELTVPLIHIIKKSGGTAIAIEKDHSLIAPLVDLDKEETAGLLEIIEGDALKLLPEIAAGLDHFKIAGNIPYYITGKLLRVISELKHRPERVVLLIQKEVAERICTAPPAMNRLAASVQFWADAAIIADVPRKDFSPPPDVDSAVIVLKIKSLALSVDPEHYYRAVRTIFAQPRKTLLNNLSELADGADAKHTIGAKLEKLGIDPGSRPQNLSINQIVAIAKAPLWG